MIAIPPTNGVVGRLLKAQHRILSPHICTPDRQAGIKVMISQIYDPADHTCTRMCNSGHQALIGDFVRHDDPHPDAADVGRRVSLTTPTCWSQEPPAAEAPISELRKHMSGSARPGSVRRPIDQKDWVSAFSRQRINAMPT